MGEGLDRMTWPWLGTGSVTSMSSRPTKKLGWATSGSDSFLRKLLRQQKGEGPRDGEKRVQGGGERKLGRQHRDGGPRAGPRARGTRQLHEGSTGAGPRRVKGRRKEGSGGTGGV